MRSNKTKQNNVRDKRDRPSPFRQSCRPGSGTKGSVNDTSVESPRTILSDLPGRFFEEMTGLRNTTTLLHTTRDRLPTLSNPSTFGTDHQFRGFLLITDVVDGDLIPRQRDLKSTLPLVRSSKRFNTRFLESQDSSTELQWRGLGDPVLWRGVEYCCVNPEPLSINLSPK